MSKQNDLLLRKIAIKAALDENLISDEVFNLEKSKLDKKINDFQKQEIQRQELLHKTMEKLHRQYVTN